jgi:hypothetical protein
MIAVSDSGEGFRGWFEQPLPQMSNCNQPLQGRLQPGIANRKRHRPQRLDLQPRREPEKSGPTFI